MRAGKLAVKLHFKEHHGLNLASPGQVRLKRGLRIRLSRILEEMLRALPIG